MAARLNIDQTETNVIEQGFNIHGHGQQDQMMNYVRANLPANHLAIIYDMIRYYSHYFPGKNNVCI